MSHSQAKKIRCFTYQKHNFPNHVYFTWKLSSEIHQYDPSVHYPCLYLEKHQCLARDFNGFRKEKSIIHRYMYILTAGFFLRRWEKLHHQLYLDTSMFIWNGILSQRIGSFVHLQGWILPFADYSKMGGGRYLVYVRAEVSLPPNQSLFLKWTLDRTTHLFSLTFKVTSNSAAISHLINWSQQPKTD